MATGQADNRLERLQDVVLAALEAESGERDRVLRERARGDESLITEAIALLELESTISPSSPLSDEFIDAQRTKAEHLFDLGGQSEGDRRGLERIGRYRVVREIARGGMGVVYECEQDHPARRVAVKTLEGPWSRGAVADRLEREAELLGQLRHPGIAHVYEAGQHETPYGVVPYFAMELIEGEQLDRYASSHTLGSDRIVDLMIEIAEAIDFAHKRGVIHRDLKPGNILVRPDGSPKLIDFGVSRLVAPGSDALTMRTQAGAIIGTLRHMSPEQARGEPGAVDIRSDVYALGSIFYELLAGHAAHDVDGEPLARAIQRLQSTPAPSLSTADPTLARDLVLIASKAMDPDPDRRYQSAAEFANDLKRYRANETILARAPTLAYQVTKFVGRNKLFVAGVSVVASALVGATIVSIGAAARARDAEQAARAETLATEQALNELLIEQRNTVLSNLHDEGILRVFRSGSESGLELLREARDKRLELLGPTSEAYMTSQGAYAAGVAMHRSIDEGEQAYAEALAVRARHLSSDNMWLIAFYEEAGLAMLRGGRPDRAEQWLATRLRLLHEHAPESVHPHMYDPLIDVARMYREQGRPESCELVLESIRADLEPTGDRGRLAVVQLGLARAADAMGDRAIAAERYVHLLEMRDGALPAGIVTPEVIREAGLAICAAGSMPDGLALLEEAFAEQVRSEASLSELLRTAESARDFARSGGDTPSAGAWQRRIDAIRSLE
ncbi:MAG: hypothetical protein Tsb0013_15880 [Phycisphaerales bacterium]